MDEKINQPENFDYIVLYIYVLDISHRSYIHTLIFDPRNFLNSTPGLHNLRKINAFKIHKYASKKQLVSIKSGNIFLEKFKLVLQIFRANKIFVIVQFKLAFYLSSHYFQSNS